MTTSFISLFTPFFLFLINSFLHPPSLTNFYILILFSSPLNIHSFYVFVIYSLLSFFHSFFIPFSSLPIKSTLLSFIRSSPKHSFILCFLTFFYYFLFIPFKCYSFHIFFYSFDKLTACLQCPCWMSYG